MKIMFIKKINNIKYLMSVLHLGAGALMLSVSPSYAVDLTNIDSEHHVKVKGTETWSIDSNPLRLTTGSDTLMGSETSVGVLLGDVTPTHKVYLDSLINYNRYDTSSFNTTNFHETLGLYKLNQRWLAGVEGRFDSDTTRTSEITSFGIAIPRVRRTGLSVAPEISFSPTTVDKLSLNSNVSQVKYNNSAFVDYKLFSLNPSYAHNFDPNNAGILIMNFQRYEPDSSTRSTTDSIGPSLGWTSIINDRLNTKVTAGIEQSRQDAQLGNPSESRLNYVFSAGVNFKGQQDVASFTASRSQQPFGNGDSVLLTSFDISEAHSLNPKVTLNASSNYSYTNYSSLSNVNLDSQFKISGGAAYHLLENLDLTGNYQYIDQKLTGTSGSIKEQVLLIGIGYRPNF